MRPADIKRHLKPFQIYARRRTTMNHAFMAAIAPHEVYDELRVVAALHHLKLDPDNIVCTYCGELAETWDHLEATVSGGVFSGFGHVMGNLVPCCKPCNSRKGNLKYSSYIRKIDTPRMDPEELINLLQGYQVAFGCPGTPFADIQSKCPNEVARLLKIRDEIFQLMQEAEELSAEIRNSFSSI